MTVISDRERKPEPNRRDLEKQLEQVQRALREARMALVDDDLDLPRLAAERDRLEAKRVQLMSRRHELHILAIQLGDFVGPIKEDADPELVARIRQVRQEANDLGRIIDEANAAADRAAREYNRVAAIPPARKARVRQLEMHVSTIERELERLNPRAIRRPSSWRDLVELKR